MKPKNDEPRGLAGGAGLETQTTGNGANSAAADATRQMLLHARGVLDKRIATARARLALQGWTCHVVNGGFTVARWGRARDIETLDELERFVELACEVRS